MTKATRRAATRVLTVDWLQDHHRIPLANLGKRLLHSYGRAQHVEATVLEPRTVADLVIFFRSLREAHAENPDARTPYCTFRAGGSSFHDQALNDEVVISLSKLDRVLKVDAKKRLVEVEPGATWGAIVTATKKFDLLPYIVVTTSRATAAGTLASDGICRASPIYGSESCHVEWLEVLTPVDEEPRRLLRPTIDSDDDDDAQLFRAVIGGFGYLGVVTRVCYRLLSVAEIEGPTDAPVRVVTRLIKKDSFGELLASQVHETRQQAHHRDDETLPEDLRSVEEWKPGSHAQHEHQSIYSIAFLGDDDDKDGYGAVYRSWYARTHEHSPYLVYHRHSWCRIFIEVMASISWARRMGTIAMWWTMRRDSERQTKFVNKLEDYLFFMDVNRQVKEWLERNDTIKCLLECFGWVMPVLQQTYVVPTARTAEFMERAATIMKRRGIRPTLFDVLFMPRDRIAMSASYECEGFACTIAFEDVRSGDECCEVEKLLGDLSHLCGQLGGRVHFTKHVYAKPEDLSAMYGPQIEHFLQLKRRYDPHTMLRNDFFDRIFLGACERPAE